jgi:NADH-quinone oxidoreductase subunit G
VPILFLRLRIAATKRGLRFAIVHPREIALSEFADVRVPIGPGGEAAAAGSGELQQALQDADRPVILLGPRVASDANALSAWLALAGRTGARVSWVPRRSNSVGALAAGAHPELLPGWRRISESSDAPTTPGWDVASMLRNAEQGRLDALWLVGADVLADVPDARLGADGLAGAKFVVVQDVQRSPMSEYADLVLPAAAFVERDGTVTDWEGRRQPVHAATDPPGAARADYAILAESARRLNRNIGCRTASDVAVELNSFLDAPAPSRAGTPAAADGQRSGDGPRLLTYRLLYDDGSRIRRTGGIRELTPGAFAEVHPNDAERAGIADGDAIRVSSTHGSITTHAQISKGIEERVVFVPWSQWGTSARALIAWDDRSPSLTLERA